MTLSKEQIRTRLSAELPRLGAAYSVKTLRLFGSFTRDAQTAASDVDLLVSFEEKPSLLTFLALEEELSGLLEMPVDLVLESALRPELTPYILPDAVMI